MNKFWHTLNWTRRNRLYQHLIQNKPVRTEESAFYSVLWIMLGSQRKPQRANDITIVFLLEWRQIGIVRLLQCTRSSTIASLSMGLVFQRTMVTFESTKTLIFSHEGWKWLQLFQSALTTHTVHDLTHYGLVTTYGIRYLVGEWIVSWKLWAIAWTI